MRTWARCAAIALPLLVAGVASADSVFVGTLERKDVKIQTYRNGAVEFSISGRRVDPVAGEKITRLVLDDEAEFSKADQAFAECRWQSALDGYQATLKATNRPWLKDWVLPRALQAADHAGRFDTAASMYLMLLPKDPVAASRLRPAVPSGATPDMLASAAGELSKASTSATLNPGAQQAVLSLLMDVNRAQGDTAAANKVAEQLLKVIPAETRDPAQARMLAEVYLGMSRLALDQKDYAKATNLIQSHRALFTEPNQQADALYLLAVAGDSEAAAKADKDALKDVAIAYLRAAAAGRPTPGKRNVPESLLRVAEIEEQLGDTKSALALYAEVATEYKDSPVSAKAAAGQQRLKEKAGM
jgi:tetratricopeptide (TPR) repeat protein